MLHDSQRLGDVKLAAVTGAALGAHEWGTALTATPLIGIGTAGAVALMLLIGGRDRRSHIPLWPAIVAGAIAALLLTGSTPASAALQLGSTQHEHINLCDT